MSATTATVIVSVVGMVLVTALVAYARPGSVKFRPQSAVQTRYAPKVTRPSAAVRHAVPFMPVVYARLAVTAGPRGSVLFMAFS